MSAPLLLNMLDQNWFKLLDPCLNLSGVFNANVIHISSWDVCIGIFKGCGSLLNKGALLIFYGYFII